MNLKDYNGILKEWVFQQGVALSGVADVTSLRKDFLDLGEQAAGSLDKGISLAVSLSDAVLDQIDDRPTQLYFHHYRQANFFLDRVAFSTALYIQHLGYSALPVPASQIIDWEQQKGHLSHKQVALEAGLGWMGKNNLLVTPVYGARIRLVTILTNLPLHCDHPTGDDCRTCTRCLKVCPAGAIKERQQDFDHRACFEQLRIFRKRDHIGQFICGVCVKACRGRGKHS